MHEYEILEQTWRKYRTKKRIKFAAIVGALLFSGVGIGYYWYSVNAKQKHMPAHTHKERNESQSIAKNLLLPDLSFEKSAERYAKAVSKTEAKRSVQKVRQKSLQQPQSQNLSQPQVPSVSPSGAKLLKAVSHDKLDLSKLQQQFAKTNDIGIALIIAKEYYGRGNYKEASRWALKANNIDKNNEESWIIFAKSAYKMGKKRTAMNALKIYYKKSRSQRALKLLRKMAQGQFR